MERPRIPRRVAIINALPILLITLAVMGIIAFIAFSTVRSVQRSTETARTACNGQPNPRLATYSPTPGTHPIVAYRQLEDGSYTPDNAVVEIEWLPEEDRFTQLVLCMPPPEPLTMPRCDAPDAEPVLYGYAQPVRLVEAATGETVASDVIPGVPPPAETCIEDADALSPPRPVTNLQIRAWLTPYVFIS